MLLLKKHTLALCAFWFISFYAQAQTNIGGVINSYVKVSNVANCSCPSTGCAQITVSSSTGFAVNDKVLLIQMKGARVDSSNSSAHGSVLGLYDAGNYELATISGIAGNVITTSNPLKETYFTNASPKDSAYVQLVKVPVYVGNVTVTSTLTPQAWNGTTGGVLAFELSGTLTLSANISADGSGFRGARRLQVTTSCGVDTAFYYQSTIWNHSSCTSCGYAYSDVPTRVSEISSYGGCSSPCTTNRMNTLDNRMAGFRGEGISAWTFRKVFANGNIATFVKGKGRWANGGGGGSNHNGGGGGGGNYGAGGFGGNAFNSTACPTGTHSKRRGYGGAALTPTATKIFMGGGGGEGHDNGGNGSTGTAGGGIIFIKASSIANTGAFSITANGVDNTVIATGDGSGGGGAGGSILLNVTGGFANATIVSASGGKGGSHSNPNCHGTGGGGGGGLVWYRVSAPPANATSKVTGGPNGIQTAATPDCGTINWGATAGGDGIVMYGLAFGATNFFNTNSCGSVLPIELTAFSATLEENEVKINWTTASEINNQYFTIEKSYDGILFNEIAQVPGAGTSVESIDYSAVDAFPYAGTNYYRLRQTDYDGTVAYSQIVAVKIEEMVPDIVVFPVPTESIVNIDVTRHLIFDATIYSIEGKIMSREIDRKDNVSINCGDFPNGFYMLKITANGKNYYRKISVNR